MKAAVCTAYGNPSVLRVVDIPVPVAKPNEVRIRVMATTVASADARIRGARFPAGFGLMARMALGLRRPRKPILGTELSGIVEATGANVTRYRVGDRVFALSGIGMGCHAEFKTMPEDAAIALIPTGFSFDEAAAISFGGTTALYFLRDIGKLQRGERVLINGASGTVGCAAVQLARHFGAHVTGVCSAANGGLVRSLGADEIVDYATEDFATSGKAWDIILDAVGNASFARCRQSLHRNGRLLLLAGGLGDLLKAPLQSLTSACKVAGGPAPERAQDIADLRELCEVGAFKAVIDRRYTLDQIADAHARVDLGRKTGSVIVAVCAAPAEIRGS